MPAPRSWRAGKVSHSSVAPVAAAVRLAADQAPLAHGRAAEEQAGGLAGAQGLGHGLDRVGVGRGAGPGGHRRGDHAAVEPAHVGRQHQGGDLAGRGAGRRHGVGRVAAHLAGGGREPHPAGRDVPGHGLDVGLELGVVLLVVGRVVADDVDHRRAGLAGVVQVGQAVAEARPEVQQRGRRPVGHAGVAVGGAGDDALEQAQHGPHLGDGVEGGHEVHLGGARVGEAGVDTGIHQGADERLGTVEAPACRLVGHGPTLRHPTFLTPRQILSRVW